MEQKSQRLMSLDAFRGFDMLFIMGFSVLIACICRAIPGGADSLLLHNMDHPAWHGFTHHDTIFPTFLFIAGISFPYSYAKMQSLGASKAKIYGKIFRRGFTLALIGLVLNGLLNFNFATLRFASVLGRIGMAWMFAALLFINTGWKTRSITCAAILVGYWLLLRFCPAPDAVAGVDPYSFEGNLVGYIDRLFLPGVLYEGTNDPEGILSTLPAIVTASMGMLTGEFIRNSRLSGNRKSLYMLLTALVMLVVGLVWSLDFPINKKLWTSTFTLVAGSYSLGLFAIFYWIIDVKECRKWTTFFRVIGMNSITIYVAMRVIDFMGISRFFLGGLSSLCPEPWANVILWTGYVAVGWLFLYVLYRKKIFLKV